jgi:hypothetical protein
MNSEVARSNRGGRKKQAARGRHNDDFVYGQRDETRVALVVTVKPAGAARRLSATPNKNGRTVR